MSDFEQYLSNSHGFISFDQIHVAAKNSLAGYSDDQKKILYNDLERGKGILDDEDHLNMYLYSFASMHKAKMYAALDSLSQLEDIFSSKIEIYDWGCGQALATICLLDYLRKKHITADIVRVNLIEPSEAAIRRAESLLSRYGIDKVVTVVKTFDELQMSDVKGLKCRKLHLFSNILDVAAFDLVKFTELFQKTQKGENFLICVGPYYGGNRRVDYFLSAINPTHRLACFDKASGDWVKDWTISLRVCSLNVTSVDSAKVVRARIDKAKKHQQFFAGYVLDCVDQELQDSDCSHEAECMMNILSAFDVRSNLPLDFPEDIEPTYAVMYNIITRGLPTKAPVALEKTFAQLYGFSHDTDKDSPFIVFPSRKSLTGEELFEALHVIDPRFITSCYNKNILESSFEQSFIKHYLGDTQTAYLAQVLEPQRWLSSLIHIPDEKFGKDQRVDFAIQLPYTESHEENQVGFIVEVDGEQYHSNIITQIKDERRNQVTCQNGWDTYRLTSTNSTSFSINWEEDRKCSSYFNILKSNYTKKLEGKWLSVLEFVLSPFAVARLETVLLHSLISGKLSLNDKVWNIAVIERDVPCTSLALKDFEDLLRHMFMLKGEELVLPKINLKLISTEEFKNSRLHGELKPVLAFNTKENFDICIDISMLLRDKIDALPINVESKCYYVVRSSHYFHEEKTVLTSSCISYPEFVTKDEKGVYHDIDSRKVVLTYFLENIFRKTSFRQGQLPIISRALSNNTTIGLLPTGGGKSLTYQLAAMLQPGVTIIVDPLITLMDDQYKGLKNLRITCCDFINSTQKADEKARKLGRLQNGNLQFVFLSPERYMMENFRSSLYVMYKMNKVYFAYGVIDEVHCVSEWGHDFRPAYLQLGRNMMTFMHTKSEKPISLIGLTATASFDVLADVERELTMSDRLKLDSESIVRPEIEERAELTYRIINVHTDFKSVKGDYQQEDILKVNSEFDLRRLEADAKKSVIRSLFKQIPIELSKKNAEDYSLKHNTVIPDFQPAEYYYPDEKGEYQYAGIIFCPHTRGDYGVQDTAFSNGLSTYLCEQLPNVSVGTFVGGADPATMHPFINNLQNEMIATKAFGMGIDKPNVRTTIHFSHPSSIEEFVQEAGRSGRDRKNAICYLLYDDTEYLHLSINTISDICSKCKSRLYTDWLWNYRGKYILYEDFADLCSSNGCTLEETKALKTIVKDFCENVDENVQLFFHNNSFRGVFKEKVMLYEMTYRIMNIRPNNLLKIQNELRELVGDENIYLKLDLKKNAIKVFGDEGNRQYGYIFLENLYPTFKFSDYTPAERNTVIDPLLGILQNLEDSSAEWLNKPQENVPESNDGIYASIENLAEDGYTYVTVTWTNSEHQDKSSYVEDIINKTNDIASKQGWAPINEERYGQFSLKKVNDFEDLLQEIYNRSQDERWLVNHNNLELFKPLLRQFSSIRDKDDTDKAIYRLSCIGLVEDVIIDYSSETYQLKVKKRKPGEYYDHMRIFFEKYYSPKKALEIVEEIKEYPTKYDNELDKCIGYLTEFVYKTLAKKRRRAIEDIRYACNEGITKGDEELKQFIHLYFNSKYAREHYDVDGVDYSLTNDVVNENWCDFDLVEKYMNVARIDSSGSEKDNVKHLYGATLLLLRDRPYNYTLHLLRAYCIVSLGVGNNDVLMNNFKDSLIEEGFCRMVEDYDTGKILKLAEKFISQLLMLTTEKKVIEFLRDARSQLSVIIYGKWFSGFANKYVN